MLTGDGLPAARRVADAVGIGDVRAEVLPADKLEAVKEMQVLQKRVAMAGDGIND